jgi:predicted aspartyl protease
MSAHPALGLDISKQNFHAALLLANGNTRAKVLPNTAWFK